MFNHRGTREADTAPRDLLVPLEQLVLGEGNVRRVHRDEGIAELAALIESQGLLQRLAVVALPDGRYAVVAGGRRLRAMQLLAAGGRLDAAQAVECRCFEDARAVEISLAENSGREAMHPADEIEPDQLQALALTDDHAAQEAVWDGPPVYERSAWALRRKLTEQSCAGDSRLARFVGLAAYEARGGTVRRDLFVEGGDAAGTPMDSAVGQWAYATMVDAFGAKPEPVRIRVMGGTVPTAEIVGALQVPFAIVPLVNSDNNQHASNENMRMGNYVDGVRTICSLITHPFMGR
jgi:ParB family chromosome partitioning protein